MRSAVPVKVASEGLNSCSGCEIAILNLGEALLTVLPHLDFVHFPVLIALWTCATHGGIPSLINQFGNDDLLDCCYHTETTDPGAHAPGAHAPGDTVPALLDCCYALDEKVKVDIYLPGCPTGSGHRDRNNFLSWKLPLRETCRFLSVPARR